MTELVAQRKSAPIYLARGQQHKFHASIAAEEEEWEKRREREREDGDERANAGMGSFEEYRERSRAAGVI